MLVGFDLAACKALTFTLTLFIISMSNENLSHRHVFPLINFTCVVIIINVTCARFDGHSGIILIPSTPLPTIIYNNHFTESGVVHSSFGAPSEVHKSP